MSTVKDDLVAAGLWGAEAKVLSDAITGSNLATQLTTAQIATLTTTGAASLSTAQTANLTTAQLASLCVTNDILVVSLKALTKLS